MEPRQEPATDDRQRRISMALGVVAGVLLGASAFFPYWQARLFAPQYRQGLTATMHLHKVTGDLQEIDLLNHYVGMSSLGKLAAWEKRLALPGLAVLVGLCLVAFRKGCPLPCWSKVAPVAAFPLIFLADLQYWMHRASTSLDPTAPLKLKPFSIPLFGTGKVGQFRSELGPQLGFLLAVAAAALLLQGLLLTRKRRGLPALLLAVLCGTAWSAEPLQPLLDRAAPGSTVELGSGRYSGPAVVSKALRLRGSGAVVDGGGSGTVLTVRAAGTFLEGLTLRGSGANLLAEDAGLRVEAASVSARGLVLEDVLFGAFASNASGFVLEDCRLSGKPLDVGRRGDLVRVWNSDRVRLSRNRLEGGRDMVLWFSTGSVIEGNEAFGGRYGLHFMHTDGARVSGNRFRDNSVGLYVMYSRAIELTDNRFERHRGPSGSGLGLKESDLILARGNVFRDNRQAIFVDQSPLVESDANLFEGNVFAYNDVAVAVMPGVRGNRFAGNAFEDNLQQVAVRGGGRLSGNAWEGNYWSDYAGYARRGEAFGAAPYRAERLVERLADAKPLARFFLYTPAAQALELAARTFPIFKPKAVVEDPRPLVRRPALPGGERGSAPALTPVLAGAWLPAGLLSASAAALALAGRGRGRAPAPARPPLPHPAAQTLGPAAQPLVRVEGLSKRFGSRRLFEELSFTAEAGECLVLWGSNGAGKSTLLRCLLGLEACEGDALVAGIDVKRDGASARERIGFLAQEFAGYDWTVRQAMEFVVRVRGADPDAISALLARCGLAGEESKPVPALSGGMKQKLALAQALVGGPELLLLDEPCSSLDLKSRRELVEILKGLKGSRTIVLTSHHLDEVEALADRVLWLEAGRPPRVVSPSALVSELGGRPS